MTRTEAYAEGFQSGRRMAERDVQDNGGRFEVDGWLAAFTDPHRAFELGVARGYRDTWARFDAGTLTWEMLEHAPVNR